MTNNPFTATPLLAGDAWQQINRLRAGASAATCNKHPEHYDARTYGLALLEGDYPQLKALFLGQWDDPQQQQCLQLFRDAASRGSVPMAIAGLLALQSHPTATRDWVWQHLSEDQTKLEFLLALASTDPDYRSLFKVAAVED